LADEICLDVRYEFSPCRSLDATPGRDTYVLDGNNHRVCYIPAQLAPFSAQVRSPEDRWDLASTIARLLNEESHRCRAAGQGERVE
jgi:hypothetical protein